MTQINGSGNFESFFCWSKVCSDNLKSIRMKNDRSNFRSILDHDWTNLKGFVSWSNINLNGSKFRSVFKNLESRLDQVEVFSVDLKLIKIKDRNHQRSIFDAIWTNLRSFINWSKINPKSILNWSKSITGATVDKIFKVSPVDPKLIQNKS